MIILDQSTVKVLQVVLGGAVVTNQLPVVVSATEYGGTSTIASYPPITNDTVTNSATPITAMAAPGTGKYRHVQGMSVLNIDTAPAVVTVQVLSGANTCKLITVTLQVGSALHYTAEAGFYVLTSTGAIVTSAGAAATDRIDFTIRNYSDVEIRTGVAGFKRVPFACTITGVRLFADAAGSIVVDIWKDTYGNFPPTVADTITAAAKPTLASAQKYEDATLTGWSKNLSEGDVLGFNVDSVTGLLKVSLALSVTRT